MAGNPIRKTTARCAAHRALLSATPQALPRLLASCSHTSPSVHPHCILTPQIDRDPKHFGGVLAYLRDGRLVLPQDARERQELRIEARYYCLVEVRCVRGGGALLQRAGGAHDGGVPLLPGGGEVALLWGWRVGHRRRARCCPRCSAIRRAAWAADTRARALPGASRPCTTPAARPRLQLEEAIAAEDEARKDAQVRGARQLARRRAAASTRRLFGGLQPCLPPHSSTRSRGQSRGKRAGSLGSTRFAQPPVASGPHTFPATPPAQDLLEKGEEAEAYIAAQRAAVVKERVQALAAAEAALAAAQEAYASLKEQERAARQACNEAGQAFHQARADGRAEAELAQLQQAWQAAADRTNELVTQLRGAHLARRQARSAVEQADDQRLAALGMSWPHYTIEVGPQHAQQAAQQAHAHGPRPMAVPVAIPLPMPPPGPLPAWLRRAFPGQQGDEAWPGDAGPGPGLWQRAQDQPHALRAAEAARELWREQAERQRLQMQRQRAAEAAEEERMRRLHARVAHQPDRAREREVHGPRERERRHVRVAEQRAPQRAAEERGARREEQRGAWREEQQRAAEAAQRRRWEEQQALQERAAAAMQALMAQLAPPPVDEEVDQQVAGGGEDMQP